MDVRPIRTDNDYEWALEEIARYFENEPEIGSADSDRFDVLTELIAAYEERQFPLPDVDAIEILVAAMADGGRTQADLAELLGSRSRASEILNRKRPLTLAMIHKLQSEWDVPAELLVKPYLLAA